MNCTEVEGVLVDFLDGRLDAAAELRLHAHLEGCADCRPRAATWRTLLPTLRGIAPAPPSAIRSRRMEVEIERRLAADTARPRRLPFRWSYVAATVAAAALLLAGWGARRRLMVTPAPEPAFATITAGAGSSLRVGDRLSSGARVVLPAGTEAALRLAAGASLTMTGPAQLTLGGDEAHVRIALDEGRLEAEVSHRRPNERFVVVVPDGRVEVRGTRFVVMARAGESWVRVTEGRVAAFDRDDHESSVGAGETHSFATAAPAASTPPPVSAAAPPVCDAPPVNCARLTKAVRLALRDRRFENAQSLLDDALRSRRGCRAPTCGTELGYLRAETLRAADRLDDAVAAYKSLDHRDAPPSTRQNALYAAAQLERRLGRLDAAGLDYERALKAAPTGALREEAMVGALEIAERTNASNALAAARRYLAAYPNGIAAAIARRIEAAHAAGQTAP